MNTADLRAMEGVGYCVLVSPSRRFVVAPTFCGTACYEAVDTYPGPPKGYTYVRRGLAETTEQTVGWLRGQRPWLLSVSPTGVGIS